MSGFGVTFYDEELKYLLRLLKALPHTIPIGETHNFGYKPDPKKVEDAGCTKTIVSHWLEISFGARKMPGPAGAKIIVAFKSRGPALEEIVTVLRDHIAGDSGMNLLLILWVDDLIEGATTAIETAGVARPIQTTAAKRLMEDDAIKEHAQKRQKTDNKEAKASKKKASDKAKKQTEQGAMNWPITDLQDDEPSPAITATTTKRGPKPNPLLDRLVISCHSISDPTIERVRCSGVGCHESMAQPRSSSQILTHASECRYLSQQLRDEALLASAGQSLGAQVVDTAATNDGIFASFKRAGADNKAAARTAQIEKTNYLTMNLLCDAGLPPALLGNPAFRALTEHLEPANGIKVASTVSSIYIPAEAARVTQLAIEELKKQYNLNLGYDGGTTMRQQSIYTLHVTTPDREVYFIKGDEASGFSHTGVHIKNLILEVMDLIGRDQFASVGSDSTGNTKLGRELAQAAVPTLLIVPDPPHYLSNTIKDIAKIEYFQDSAGKMRMTITYLSHSTYSATHLEAMRVIMGINKGFEKVGKTRFGTLYWSGYSLLRCLPGISELIKLGIIDVDGSDKNFELELQQFCAILESIARAIKCFEGLNATVGDVWKFYVAITAVLHDFFETDEFSVPLEVREEAQFEAYTRQYPPFSARSETWSKAIQYWRSLAELPEASVLAFLVIKIFSILPKSMPEERTVSRFTRTDTRDRANQEARTIVAQTKIYQHNRRVARVADKSAKVSNCPSLKWRSVKDFFSAAKAPSAHTVIDLTTDDSSEASGETRPGITLECQAGLEALNSVNDLHNSILAGSTPYQPTLESHRDGVDIHLPFFKDLLSDKPVEGADSIRSLGD
ncbi:ribonuclease H-like domain-containing protein [Mycena rebaudengoi]|nr:ribonuclease H-like domain-containing protein [Mycena rebaudengoi]